MYVLDVMEEDLAPEAFDEEGNVEDWTIYRQGGHEDGLFDSMDM